MRTVDGSGTTLVRAMLDAHSDIRCGEETRVVPRILQLAAQWNRSAKETNRLHEAGLTDQIIGDAVAAFILEVVVKHGEPAPRVCNKDPFTLKYGVYLLKLFPQAKFIFMIRDGRAVVHSLISRKVTVTGFDLTDYRQCLTKWSNSMKTMLKECEELGPDKCLKVKYENLVLHPKSEMEKILKYLGLPWMDDVLHHEQFITSPEVYPCQSKVERSSDQVVKPVNVEALTKWVGAIPDDVVRDMETIAPMLSNLGYSPKDNRRTTAH
ncbi:Protein-tyrosine sulfotransferase [Orchesella cincta]|uniref:Protein-tyrosine sulfotransferase n=1 Tax=Orchesella cincta TaxID=48709 RepID=A0A1D2NI26_ORCCI|nr:Protein-tyrosine sulfotransferase [Orchesella cincta]